jgi:hypothetical protein
LGLLKTSYSGNSCFCFILIFNFEIQGTSSSGCSKEANKKMAVFIKRPEKDTLFCKRLFDFFKNMFVNQGYIILEQILWFFEKGDNQIKEPP